MRCWQAQFGASWSHEAEAVEAVEALGEHRLLRGVAVGGEMRMMLWSLILRSFAHWWPQLRH